ncbi:MAG: hypothetical protein M3Z87_20710 [Lactobacillus sp.]|nr:hypothetical protein [Lactobacillus sp.]
MARNSSGRLTVIERLSCARISAGIRLVYSCLVDLYRQAQVSKKTVPTITVVGYGIGLFN